MAIVDTCLNKHSNMLGMFEQLKHDPRIIKLISRFMNSTKTTKALQTTNSKYIIAH